VSGKIQVKEFSRRMYDIVSEGWEGNRRVLVAEARDTDQVAVDVTRDLERAEEQIVWPRRFLMAEQVEILVA
jgi:hypothetical protein